MTSKIFNDVVKSFQACVNRLKHTSKLYHSNTETESMERDISVAPISLVYESIYILFCI